MNVAGGVGVDRWRIAQTAEAEYWTAVRNDDVELLRILHQKAAAMAWVRQQVPEAFELPGFWVEIGIGPLGVGCLHLMGAAGRDLIGIDPLSPIDLAETLSPAVRGLLAGCRIPSYRHIVGRGERLEIETATSALAVCYNVLDHCDDPTQVVRESARVLKPGAHFVLGCDVYSVAGRAKYRLRAALAAMTDTVLDSIGDRAHPHQFVAADLEGLVNGTNLEIRSINRRPAEALRRVWSRAHRMLIVARKKAS